MSLTEFDKFDGGDVERGAGATSCHRMSTGHEALAAPRRIILTQEASFMQAIFVTEFEHGKNPRHIDALRPIISVAVLCQGDVLHRVRPHMERSIPRNGLSCSLEVAGTSVDENGPQGLSRPENAAPEHAFPWRQVPVYRETNSPVTTRVELCL
jgi:hypothetical protein